MSVWIVRCFDCKKEWNAWLSHHDILEDPEPEVVLCSNCYPKWDWIKCRCKACENSEYCDYSYKYVRKGTEISKIDWDWDYGFWKFWDKNEPCECRSHGRDCKLSLLSPKFKDRNEIDPYFKCNDCSSCGCIICTDH